MDEKPLRTYKKDGLILRIWQDMDPMDPREEDNLGTMVCFHKQYILGDKTDLKSERFDSWNSIEKHLLTEEDAEIILPLFLLDHSGITMRTRSFSDVDPGNWDSGMVGYIYTSKDAIRQRFNKKRLSKSDLDRAQETLEAEVKTYDQYLRGDMYDFTIVKPVTCKCCGHVEEEPIDSCGGFYNIDDILEEAEFIGIEEEEGGQ